MLPFGQKITTSYVKPATSGGSAQFHQTLLLVVLIPP